jgi:hypothetical protein
MQVEKIGGRDPLHQNTCVFNLLLFTWCRWKRVVVVTLSILVLVIMVVVGFVHTHRKRDMTYVQLLQNLVKNLFVCCKNYRQHRREYFSELPRFFCHVVFCRVTNTLKGGRWQLQEYAEIRWGSI